MKEILDLYQRYLDEEKKHPPDAVPQNFILGDFSADSKDRKIRAIRDRLEEISNNSSLLDINPDWLDSAITTILKGADVEDENLPAAYALMMYDATAQALGDRAESGKEELTPVPVDYQVDLYDTDLQTQTATPFLLMAYTSILFALKCYAFEHGITYNQACLEFYPKGISSVPVTEMYSEQGDQVLIPDPVTIRFTNKIYGDKGGVSKPAAFAFAIMMVKRVFEERGVDFPINFREWLNEMKAVESALESESDSAYCWIKREGINFIVLAHGNLIKQGIIPRRFTQAEMTNALSGKRKGAYDFFNPELMVKKNPQKEGTIFPDNQIPCVRWQFKPESVTAKRSHMEWGTQYSTELLTSLVLVDETLKLLKGDENKKVLGAVFSLFHSKCRKGLDILKSRRNQVLGEPGAEIHPDYARYERAIAFYSRFVVATIGTCRQGVPMTDENYELGLSLIYDQLEEIELDYKDRLNILEGQYEQGRIEDDLIPPIDPPDPDYSDLPELFQYPHLFLDFLARNLRCSESNTNIVWDSIHATDAQIATPESLSWAIRWLDSALEEVVPGEIWPAPDLWHSTDRQNKAFSFIYDPAWQECGYTAKSSIIDRAYARLVKIAPYVSNRKMEMETFIKKATSDWIEKSSFADTNIGEKRIPVALNVFSSSQIFLPPYSQGQVEAIRQFADPTTLIYPMQRTPGKPIVGAELMLVTPAAIANKFQSGVYRCFYPGEFPFEEARSLYTESGWLRQLLCQSGHRLGEAIPGANRWNHWYTRYRGGFTSAHIVPDVDWGFPEARTLGLFERCLTIISGGDWHEDAEKREAALHRLFDYLLWALGYNTEAPNWEESPWSEHDTLHQVVAQLPLWLQLYPADYFSELINASSISLYNPNSEEALLGCVLESGVAVIPNIEVGGRITHAMQLGGNFHRAVAMTNSLLHAKALLIGWLIYAPHLVYPIAGQFDIHSIVQTGFTEGYLLDQEPDIENSPLPVILLKERSAIDVPASPVDDKPSGGGKPKIIPRSRDEQAKNVIQTAAQAKKGNIIQSAKSQQKGVIIMKAQDKSNPQSIQAKSEKSTGKLVPQKQVQAEPLGQALPDLSALKPQQELVEIERTVKRVEFRRMEINPGEM